MGDFQDSLFADINTVVSSNSSTIQENTPSMSNELDKSNIMQQQMQFDEDITEENISHDSGLVCSQSFSSEGTSTTHDFDFLSNEFDKTIQDIEKIDVDSVPGSEEYYNAMKRVVQVLQNEDQNDYLGHGRSNFLSDSQIQLIFKPDNDADTMLMIALAKRWSKFAADLIAICPNVCLLNQKNCKGQTALHIATYLGERLIVERLIEKHADISLVDVQGKTIFHLIAQTGSVVILETIIKSCNKVNIIERLMSILQKCDAQNDQAFLLSISYRNFEVAKCMAMYLGPVAHSIVDPRTGNNALHTAIVIFKDAYEDFSFIKFLVVKCQFRPKWKNYQGENAVKLAERLENSQLYTFLCSCF